MRAYGNRKQADPAAVSTTGTPPATAAAVTRAQAAGLGVLAASVLGAVFERPAAAAPDGSHVAERGGRLTSPPTAATRSCRPASRRRNLHARASSCTGSSLPVRTAPGASWPIRAPSSGRARARAPRARRTRNDERRGRSPTSQPSAPGPAAPQVEQRLAARIESRWKRSTARHSAAVEHPRAARLARPACRRRRRARSDRWRWSRRRRRGRAAGCRGAVAGRAPASRAGRLHAEQRRHRARIVRARQRRDEVGAARRAALQKPAGRYLDHHLDLGRKGVLPQAGETRARAAEESAGGRAEAVIGRRVRRAAGRAAGCRTARRVRRTRARSLPGRRRTAARRQRRIGGQPQPGQLVKAIE